MSVSVYKEFLSYYEKFGDEKYMIDEIITQKSHVLQAAFLAKKCDAPDWVIIGMLFHDIGQLIGIGKKLSIDELHLCHNILGKDWLKDRGFPEKVYNWIEYHTFAKIILVDENPYYFDRLSTASKDSYKIQKEFTKNSESFKKFLSDEYKTEYKTMRLLDDLSKIDLNKYPLKLYDFDYYAELINKVILNDYININKDKENKWIEEVNKLYKLSVDNYDKFIKVVSSV